MRRRQKTKTSEKHKYFPQEIVFSSGWVTEDFRLADKQRQIERDERKANTMQAYSEIIGIIEEENILSLAYLTRLILTQYVQYKPHLKELAPLLRDYLNSRKNDVACGFADMTYNQVCKAYKSAQLHEIELQDDINELWQVINDLKCSETKKRDRILELETRLDEVQKFSNHCVQRNIELQKLLEFDKIF